MLPAKAGPLDLGEEEKRSMDRQASSVSFVISPTRTSDVGPPGPSPVNAAFRQTARSVKQPRKTRPSLNLFGGGQKQKQQSTSSLVSIKNSEEEGLWENAAIEDSSQVEFPKDGRRCPIFDPFTPYRVAWDLAMMGAILFVMIVTPFEMAFIADPGTFIRLPAAPSSVWLWCMNRLIDFGFFVDLLLAFNTAYFDEASGHWVTDRYVIARSYLQAWFWLDLVSLVPYSVLPVSEKAGLLRFVKLARLMRLLRAFKSPRILANLYKHITLHNRTQTLVKYITLLIVTIHWSACCLRLATSIHLDKCGEHHDKCPATVLTDSKFWVDGVWPQYLAAVLWAFQCLQGESAAETHVELLLNVVVMLLGCLELAFMLGELTNTLTNLDPVGNEFKLTFDSLNDYMTKKNFPIALRLRLREYIMLAEPVYRDNYYRALLEKLSPRLEAIVAHQNLGNVVNRIPFFAYTVQRAYGVNTGSLVALKPSRDVTDADAGAAGDVRLAHVVNVPTYLKYDVEYVDDASVETGVSHARVVVDRNDVALRTKIQQTLYQRDHFVIAVARLLEPQLVMHSDIIVYRNLSLNDVMYIVETGYIVLFGADPTRSERVLVRKSNDSFGDDIAMNVGGKEPVLRQFTAKAKRKTRLFTLGSGRFNALLEGPTFSIFRTYISLYGRWMRIRMVLFRGLKSGQVRRQLTALRSRRALAMLGASSTTSSTSSAPPPPPPAARVDAAPLVAALLRLAPAGDGELLAAFGAGDAAHVLDALAGRVGAPVAAAAADPGARATQLRTLCEAVCRGLVDLAFRNAAPPGVAPLVLDLAARLRGRTPAPAAGDDGYDRDDDDDDLRYRPADDGDDPLLDDFATTLWHGQPRGVRKRRARRDGAPACGDGLLGRDWIECVTGPAAGQ